ncbi:hypothetical protein LA345_13420 [Burkholderia vietnamiensis]|uniref:Lipoprotein n=1 Tax=Burkholderia vietnamiensis (strain G4 / LMG 22486) TaxID=269482 RepID=A4JFV6_BURVG|nr:hypothetical protein Bcep1808_2157 [Burkholderia vietnamiensis G4]MCB4344914.1 hypothetical protein [Burkholderia vietnamiensis]
MRRFIALSKASLVLASLTLAMAPALSHAAQKIVDSTQRSEVHCGSGQSVWVMDSKRYDAQNIAHEQRVYFCNGSSYHKPTDEETQGQRKQIDQANARNADLGGASRVLVEYGPASAAQDQSSGTSSTSKTWWDSWLSHFLGV